MEPLRLRQSADARLFVAVTTREQKTAVIVGAGPAGLTAALELTRRSDLKPIVFEADAQVGGISKTINYRGNRMDLGGHRFFSKSDWVMRWWQQILPLADNQVPANDSFRIHYQHQSRDWTPESLGPASSDAVMLVRRRLSRIFYRRRFFAYPLTLNADSLRNLGIIEAAKIGMSYGRARFRSIDPEVSLQDFLINRFGDRLYRTFFREYTEKVWGVPCQEISAEWGAQRIKGLSIAKAIGHALTGSFRNANRGGGQTETSLIEQFLYPKLGPGQMWEEAARRAVARGAELHLRHRIVGVEHDHCAVSAVNVLDEETSYVRRVPCDFLISTMPVQELIEFLKPSDDHLNRIAKRLPYRDFMTAGLLVRRMTVPGSADAGGNGLAMPPDNWIYIQEPDVRIGRLQIFNNWSPALVANPNTIWLGLEYFCREGDDLWSQDDGSFIDFAAAELEQIGLINRRDVIDGTLVRVRKAYPAYFGTYSEFGRLRTYLDQFANLYPIGRNGMHRYNNQDHSMLAADGAVSSILAGGGKERIWEINADGDYHEEVSRPAARQQAAAAT